MMANNMKFACFLIYSTYLEKHMYVIYLTATIFFRDIWNKLNKLLNSSVNLKLYNCSLKTQSQKPTIKIYATKSDI